MNDYTRSCDAQAIAHEEMTEQPQWNHSDRPRGLVDKARGAIIHIVLTVLFFSIISILTFTQFEGQSDSVEATAAMTEMVQAVTNATTYFISNGNDYDGLDADYLGIGDNLYGSLLAVSGVTATGATIEYPGFPSEDLCNTVGVQLRRMDFIDSAATSNGITCVPSTTTGTMMTATGTFQAEIVMDDSR